MGFDSVKDSGERREANTGAVRDRGKGKGRYDLISGLVLIRLEKHPKIWLDGVYGATCKKLMQRATEKLYRGEFENAFFSTSSAIEIEEIPLANESASGVRWLFGGLTGHSARRLAIHLENGAVKYAPRNWEKGFPFSWCLDSAIRHCFKYLAGSREEDHLAAVLCNLMFILHFREAVKLGLLPKELDDLPHGSKKAKKKGSGELRKTNATENDLDILNRQGCGGNKA